MDSNAKTLESILYRLKCPPQATLGEYEMGLLDFAEADEIAAHTSACPLCQADLVKMRQFLALPMFGEAADNAPEEAGLSLIERIKIVVVDLLAPPPGIEMPVLVPAVMRGMEDGVSTRVFHVDPYVIALSSIKNSASWQKRQIIGDIMTATGDEESFKHWTTYLWRAGKLLAASPVDQDCHFIFEDVQVNDKPYDLMVSGPQVEILMQNLRLA